MLTLTLKSGERKSFNLKSFDREKALRDAWRAMHGDEKYFGKKFKIGTMDGDQFEVRINDMVSVEFEDCEYCEAVAEDMPKGNIFESLSTGGFSHRKRRSGA